MKQETPVYTAMQRNHDINLETSFTKETGLEPGPGGHKEKKSKISLLVQDPKSKKFITVASIPFNIATVANKSNEMLKLNFTEKAYKDNYVKLCMSLVPDDPKANDKQRVTTRNTLLLQQK